LPVAGMFALVAKRLSIFVLTVVPDAKTEVNLEKVFELLGMTPIL